MYWVQARGYGTVPLPRIGNSAVVYNNRLFIFGGWSPSCLYNDVFTFDLDTFQWEHVKTHGKGPSPRCFQSGCVVGENWVIFGGYNANASFFNDTYLLNLETFHWKRVRYRMHDAVHDVIPRARQGHTAVEWCGRRMVVFGGMARTGGTVLSDTLVFNQNDARWEPLHGGRTGAPCPRLLHAATSIDSQMWIFGGRSQTFEELSDLWYLDLNTRIWFQVVPGVGNSWPLPREGHQLVAVNQNKLLLFGGWDGRRNLNDTWVYNSVIREWRSGEPSGAQPPPRDCLSLCSAQRKAILYSGRSGQLNLDDLWILDLSDIVSTFHTDILSMFDAPIAPSLSTSTPFIGSSSNNIISPGTEPALTFISNNSNTYSIHNGNNTLSSPFHNTTNQSLTTTTTTMTTTQLNRFKEEIMEHVTSETEQIRQEMHDLRREVFELRNGMSSAVNSVNQIYMTLQQSASSSSSSSISISSASSSTQFSNSSQGSSNQRGSNDQFENINNNNNNNNNI